MPKTKRHPTHAARELARKTADRYCDALTAEIPYDNAPGGVELVTAWTQIAERLRRDDLKTTPNNSEADDREHFAVHAGYFPGLEIGRRLGGVAMKVYAGDDLQGRIIRVETRLAMSRNRSTRSRRPTAIWVPRSGNRTGIRDVEEELVEEIRAIQEPYVDQSNADYFKIRRSRNRRCARERPRSSRSSISYQCDPTVAARGGAVG